MKNIGYEVSPRTFERYLHSVRATGSAVKMERIGGAKSLLNDEQKAILCGWVFTQNENNKIVQIKHCIEFINGSFGIMVSTTTAHGYLHDAGFSSRTTKNKRSGYQIEASVLKELIWNWINERRIEGILDWIPSKMCSIDFVYTGHHNDHRKTYSQAGSSQPTSDIAISSYTNCIITCIWADGKNRTPAVLYTFNKAFRTDIKNTKKQKEKYERLIELLTHYEINSKRCIYMGDGDGETRYMVSESSDLLRIFFEKYKIPKNCVIFSDCGNAFFDKGNSVLNELGFDIHRTYPAPVHRYLSPNDNNLHGSSKSSWRQSDIDFQDDVSSSLMLLNHIDVDTIAYSKHWFNRNIIRLEEDDVMGLIGNLTMEKSKYKEECMNLYQNFINNTTNNNE